MVWPDIEPLLGWRGFLPHQNFDSAVPLSLATMFLDEKPAVHLIKDHLRVMSCFFLASFQSSLSFNSLILMGL